MTKIYSGPLSMFGAKVEIAAREKGIAFELEMVAFDQANGYSPRHAEVLRINPKRQVPVLIDDAVEIFDSTQIFEYLQDRWPQPPLWPASPQARARARLLELKSDEVLFAHVIRLMVLETQRDSPEWATAQAGVFAYYDVMERELAAGPYLQDDYSFADIALFMAQYFAARKGAAITNAWPRLNRWRDVVARRPAVATVIGAMQTYLHRCGLPVPTFEAPTAT